MLAESVSSVSWSRQEFSGLDLGDIRLNDRLIDVADALVSHPTSTINAACGDWASAKAGIVYLTMIKCRRKHSCAPLSKDGIRPSSCFCDPRYDILITRITHQPRV